MQVLVVNGAVPSTTKTQVLVVKGADPANAEFLGTLV